MNLLKIITILNWVVIAVLGALVALETFFPAKGGEAAGRGMGLFVYYVSIAVLAVLLILNLLPYPWARYAAFGLVSVPFLYMQLNPIIGRVKRNIGYRMQASQPLFEDKERDQIARVIREGEPDKLKKLLEIPIARLNDRGELLAYAIHETSGTAYRPAEKLECIRLLFAAGAKLDSATEDDIPIHMSVAETGNAALLRLLLEQGADANAVQKYAKRPVLFEAIGSYQDPVGSVRVLLEFGADPNSRALLDDEFGEVSPLWHAAQLERWGVCLVLLEKGANPDFSALNGKSVRDLVLESARDYPKEGYSTQADYDALKKILH